MARTDDADSATAQFFINVVDNTKKLDSGRSQTPTATAVFGKVIEGMDVVDKIKDVETKIVVPNASRTFRSRT